MVNRKTLIIMFTVWFYGPLYTVSKEKLSEVGYAIDYMNTKTTENTLKYTYYFTET